MEDVQTITPVGATLAPLRGLTKRWRCAGAAASHLPLLARVLAARGLADPDAAALFLSPSLTHMHDPSRLAGLDRAAERLLAAARAGEPIVIYGDYDVDGVSATAILFHMLRAVAPACVVSCYVPHRLEDGYGINTEAVVALAAAGAKVIVSVDCGITALEPALAARAAGVDLIITDHHNPLAAEHGLPDAYAVVHPRCPADSYPFGDLCGAGVALKLAWRLATMSCGSPKVTPELRALLLDLLALAALGVIADVVPLVGENRVIAHFGLRRIKMSPLEGLRALVRASGLDGEKVEADGVGFKLGPRLNACGRLGHAREAVELLTTATGKRATDIAEELTRVNDRRRQVERSIFVRACELAEAGGMTGDDNRAIVLADAGWHAGVVGIVCSRLVEKYHRPAILLASDGETCHGSGRSVRDFSLHAALVECASHLHQFGGHDAAAGMKLALASLPAFTEMFTAVANREIGVERLCGHAEFDTDAAIAELTPPVVAKLHDLGPFGRDNPEVRVRLCGVKIAMRPEVMGAESKHLVMRLADQRGGGSLRVVAWNWGPRVRDLAAGMEVDALVSPKISTFNGGVEAELVDLAIRDATVRERS